MSSKQYLGREGVLNDTQPTKHEAIFRQLKNNELEMLKNNKAFYDKLKQEVKGEQK